MVNPAPSKTPKDEDKTWVVALVVFGLMGIGGPILAFILFFIIANMI